MPDRKLMDRWIPRLDDKSDGVKEKAVTMLAEVALRDEASREEIIPKLLHIARTSNHWPLVANGVLFHTSEIPKIDPRWVEPFFDAYIHIAAKNQTVSSKNSYLHIHELLECGAIRKDHPKLESVYETAQKRLKIDDDDDIREKLFAIIDWYEDNI